MSEFLPQGGIRVRPLQDADLDTRVRWLSDDRVRNGITIEFWPERVAMSSWLARTQEDDSRRDYAVVDDGEVVAMVGLLGITGDAAALYIYVDPDRHGRKYGTRAMLALIEAAHELGIERLTLETKSSNTIARDMYRKLGFKTDEEHEDKIFMSRRILGAGPDHA